MNPYRNNWFMEAIARVVAVVLAAQLIVDFLLPLIPIIAILYVAALVGRRFWRGY